VAGFFEHCNEHLGSIKGGGGGFFSFSKKTLLHGVERCGDNTEKNK
jgi:hypothetical protein